MQPDKLLEQVTGSVAMQLADKNLREIANKTNLSITWEDDRLFARCKAFEHQMMSIKPLSVKDGDELDVHPETVELFVNRIIEWFMNVNYYDLLIDSNCYARNRRENS